MKYKYYESGQTIHQKLLYFVRNGVVHSTTVGDTARSASTGRTRTRPRARHSGPALSRARGRCTTHWRRSRRRGHVNSSRVVVYRKTSEQLRTRRGARGAEEPGARPRAALGLAAAASIAHSRPSPPPPPPGMPSSRGQRPPPLQLAVACGFVHLICLAAVAGGGGPCEFSVARGGKLYSFSLASPTTAHRHGVLSEDGYVA